MWQSPILSHPLEKIEAEQGPGCVVGKTSPRPAPIPPALANSSHQKNTAQNNEI